MLFLLLSGMAFAETPTPLTPAPTLATPDVPSLAEGINKVDAGVVLLLADGTKFRIPVKSWLLPDPYYREAITKAKQLEVYQPALDTCTTKALDLQIQVAQAMDTCSEQFASDETLIADLNNQVRSLETRALTTEGQNKDLRSQRNVAWAITGGLVLGAITITAVSIAP